MNGPGEAGAVVGKKSRGKKDKTHKRERKQFDRPVGAFGIMQAKLADPDGGLTLILGLPYLRFSPAHGTAFDIAGRGLAREQNLLSAVLEAARWVRAGAQAGFCPEPLSEHSSPPLVP